MREGYSPSGGEVDANTRWTGRRAAAVASALLTCMVVAGVLLADQGSHPFFEGRTTLLEFWKAPEIQLAENTKPMFARSSGGLAQWMRSKQIQLDSVRPLLSSKFTANLAAVTEAVQTSHKQRSMLTLQGVPTLVTLTVPEDVTISRSSLPFTGHGAATSKLSQAEPDPMATYKKYFNKTQGDLFNEWGYQNGVPNVLPPSLWFLKTGWETCRSGERQAPINIIQQVAKGGSGLLPLLWMCGKTPCQDANLTDTESRQFYDGHAFTIDSFQAEGSPKMLAGKVTYSLQEVKLHTPSENMLDGLHYDMEMQLLHRSVNGTSMMVSVFFTAGSGNDSPSWIQAIADTIRPCLLSTEATDCKLSGTPTHLTDDFLFRDVASTLTPLLSHYFRFDGSLTRPPCSEGVVWNVIRKPLKMDQDDWTLIAALQGKNNRPVQHFHNRPLTWT